MRPMYPTELEVREHYERQAQRLVRRPMTDSEQRNAVERMIVASGVSPGQREWLRGVLEVVAPRFTAAVDPRPVATRLPAGRL